MDVDGKRRFLNFHSPPLLWAGLIFIVSSFPLETPPTAGPFSDKIIHVLEYAIFGFLLARSFHHIRNQVIHKIFLFAALGIGILYGLTDEIHQHFVSYRFFEWTDLIADTLGSGIGTLIYKSRSDRIKPL